MGVFKNIDFINPRIIIVLTAIVVVWVNFNINLWQNRRVIQHDISFYYSYLPSAFYFNDLSQSFLKDSSKAHLISTFCYPPKAPNGNYVFKSTIGMALTYLPFYSCAKIYAQISGYDKSDIYAPPFQFAVQFSSLFYFIFGLIFLIRTLQIFYSKRIVALTLFLIIFGTNVIYYLTVGAGMSHAADFGLASCFLYYAIKWHYQNTFKSALLIGITGGLLTLIRPINILVFIFFILYNVKSTKDIGEKMKLFIKNKYQILLIACLGILIFLPQMIYWKTQTGSWFFNSYVNEHFFFDRPQIINGLFSFRKGWLIYTPIMLFPLIGIYFIYKKQKQIFTAIFFLFLIYIYVAFSWWCWWYGGSFGQRALIDIYPFLAIPFAAFLTRVAECKTSVKRIVYATIILMISLNIFQSIQAKYNIIHYDSMTKEAYVDAFFRTTKNPEREKFLKHPDDKKAMAGINEY